MNRAIEFQNNEDLAFFGKVNASISHELKNILAIISETAGLLNDLTKMATKGQNFELEMMKTCSQDIVEEIQRGFATIKQMNIFSHSVDDPLKRVNLSEVLDLIINLAGFLSFASKVHFDPPVGAAPIVLTCPWRLQNLIYQTLVFAFESVGPDGEIQVSLHPQNDGSARITLAGLGLKAVRKFPGDQTIQIAESISAEIVVSEEARTVDILVPEFIKGLK
jgi:C4-dicarboxylate-specific signal transduction histidine kinase